jgi:aspartate/methionine/tyrosine aminotransferase
MMKTTPVSPSIVDEKIAALEVEEIGSASIREIVQLVSSIEAATGIKYIRMEMGIPGLPPSKIGVEAEIEALRNGVASKYPQIDGIPELKKEASRFIKLFMDIDVKPEGCIPTVGSMEGSYAAFLVTAARDKEKDTALFIDPGFPVQKQQMMVMNQKYLSFDVFEFRGEKLRDKLESYLSKGNHR